MLQGENTGKFLFHSCCSYLGILETIIAQQAYAAFFIVSQETNNALELVEKMNTRVAEEYKGFGDVASGLRIFVEQLKSKSGSFDEYVQQIDTIEQQVTEFEAVISMLDKYVSLLESKVQSAYQIPPPWINSFLSSFCFYCNTLKAVPGLNQTWFSYVIKQHHTYNKKMNLPTVLSQTEGGYLNELKYIYFFTP